MNEGRDKSNWNVTLSEVNFDTSWPKEEVHSMDTVNYMIDVMKFVRFIISFLQLVEKVCTYINVKILIFEYVMVQHKLQAQN